MKKEPISFTIEKKMKGELGRAGILTTKHGVIKTPAFVAVGTKATVKTIIPEQLKSLGSQVCLSNTYHLYLEPGKEVIKKSGGLGKFMNWSGPTMTDSGGFQVFSLGAAYGKGISKILHNGPNEPLLPNIENEKEIPKIAKIDPDGVTFRDHSRGDAHYFTPEKAIQIQHDIGADIIFAFDECTAPTESKHYQMEALDRTHRWARKCLQYHVAQDVSKDIGLFGVVQGGREEDLRKESATFLKDLRVNGKGFDGFGIGGSFAKEDMSTAVKWVNEILPENKPRHLLGIGEPKDLFMGVRNGVDLFDCVAPTRIARNGQAYTYDGKINLSNAKFREDLSPIDSECDCYTCKHYSKAYITHLMRSKEALAMTLVTIHNLRFIVRLVDTLREKLIDGTFDEYEKEFLTRYEKI